MMTFLYIVGSLILLFIAFIVWRITSVGRGARQRDEKLMKLLDPLGRKLDAGEEVSKDEILELARKPELRLMLFFALRELKREDLIPEGFDSEICQAETALCYWMMHPNELQDAPETIEHTETISRSINGKDERFHFFKYQMAEGHWSERDWLIGFCGPMHEQEQPYESLQPAFSRCGDVVGKISHEEILDWWIDIMKSKGMIAAAQ